MSTTTTPPPTADSLTTAYIAETTKKFKYPISAAFIGKQLGIAKRDVNSFISKHRNDFLKFECQPPLWMIRPTAVDPAADDSVVLELQKLTLEPTVDSAADPK